jgi:hypothetical protein
MSVALDAAHRDTVAKLFAHPGGGNVEWREVLSLLEAVGTVTRQRNGKLRIELGDQAETVQEPRTKDVDEDTIVDLRRMLRQAGVVPT